MHRGLFGSLDLLLDRAKIPEGFAVALPQTVSLAAAVGSYGYPIPPGFDFWLEAVISKWTEQTVDSNPSISIFRDEGQRGLQNGAVDLREISTPGAAPAGVASLNHLAGIGIKYGAGSVVQMNVTGHIPGSPATMRIIALGRYIKRQDA